MNDDINGLIELLHEQAALSAAPGLSDGGLREKIARVIEPGAWEKSGGSWRYRDWHVVQCAALAKADAILALSAAPERVGGGGWREIESAPRDGTWFVALQNGDTYPCEWLSAEPDEGPGREGWWDHFNESFEEPTHWQPLPSPPIGAEGGRPTSAGVSRCGEGTQEPSPSGAQSDDGRGGA